MIIINKSMLQWLFISDIHYYSIYISFTNNIIIKCLKTNQNILPFRRITLSKFKRCNLLKPAQKIHEIQLHLYTQHTGKQSQFLHIMYAKIERLNTHVKTHYHTYTTTMKSNYTTRTNSNIRSPKFCYATCKMIQKRITIKAKSVLEKGTDIHIQLHLSQRENSNLVFVNHRLIAINLLRFAYLTLC